MADTNSDPSILSLALRALDTATSRGARYADVRVVRRKRESLSMRNGNLEAFEFGEDIGFGVRVFRAGGWGFASSSVLTSNEADRVSALAVSIAKASERAPWRADFEPSPGLEASCEGPCEIDPFEVSFERKMELLSACDEAMRQEPRVRVALGTLDFLREERTFVSTQGAEIFQTILDSGGGLRAIAISDGVQQQRSYPHIFGWSAERGGFEALLRWKLDESAARIAAEASALLDAPSCPEGEATVILDASQTCMQLHESLGHALELDRVLGMEAATAGTSFLTPEKLGDFRVGSELVSVVVDPTLSAPGSHFYDDEGTPGSRAVLIDHGRLVNYLSSRDTAAAVGLSSTSCSRAQSWNRLPLVRMTTVNLEPGSLSMPEMLADTDNGYLLSTTRSWSIDEHRLNFEFASELAWEVKGGELKRLLRGPSYTGTTPTFWAKCDAVGNQDSWATFSVSRCFKGQPGQLVRVSHGASPTRFRDISLRPT